MDSLLTSTPFVWRYQFSSTSFMFFALTSSQLHLLAVERQNESSSLQKGYTFKSLKLTERPKERLHLKMLPLLLKSCFKRKERKQGWMEGGSEIPDGSRSGHRWITHTRRRKQTETETETAAGAGAGAGAGEGAERL